MPQAQQPEESTPTPVRSPSVWADAADEPVPVDVDEDDPDVQELFFSAQRIEKREWGIKLQEILAKRQRRS
eukprot:2672627-Pyramimonas_sp.AAC.1